MGLYNADSVPCAVWEESEEAVDDLRLRTMHERLSTSEHSRLFSIRAEG